MVATTVAPMALAQASLAAAQGFSAQAQVLLALAQILALPAQDQPRRRRPRRRGGGRSASSVEPAPSTQEEAAPSVESLSCIATPCWSEAEEWCFDTCDGVAAAPPGLMLSDALDDVSVDEAATGDTARPDCTAPCVESTVSCSAS